MDPIENEAAKCFMGVVLAALQLKIGHSCGDALARVCGWP